VKFFNKKALTLAELVISLVIIWVLVGGIFIFITMNVEELADNNVKISLTKEWLDFQETIMNFIDSWYSTGGIISLNLPNENEVLYLKKPDSSAWVLIWIIDSNTKKIQKNYVYWDNFVGYRELSQSEVSEIDINNNLAFDKIFQGDKLFLNLRAKDFKLELYNWKIVNLHISIVKKVDESLFWTDFADLNIEDIVIGEYDLTF
jgi:hypothetical protein